MSWFRNGRAGLALLMAALLGTASSAEAHEIRPAVVTITIGETTIDVAITLNAEGVVAGIGPDHKDTDDAPETLTYKSLRALSPDELRARFDAGSRAWRNGLILTIDGRRVDLQVNAINIQPVGDVALARLSTVTATAVRPAGATTLTWTYPRAYGSAILRVRTTDGDIVEGGWLKDGQTSAAIALTGAVQPSQLRLLFEYMHVGFTHILPKGLDHILFVLGLYFLGSSWRPLLMQVTAFTLAHSITLALGLYGVVDVSPRIVEPLIALSIVYVAVENLLTNELKPWRPVVVFLFGLLHGLGFAGILRDADLQPASYLSALVGFNIGVELGQFAVIALAWIATGYWLKSKWWYRARVAWPASVLIALCGLGWTIERIWFV